MIVEEPAVLQRMQEAVGNCCCAPLLAELDPVLRVDLLNRLFFDRLEHKMGIVDRLRKQANDNWNQTFYLLYFRTLGDSQNQAAFLTLAETVRYGQLLWERQKPHVVEAMLLGAAGLLSLCPQDDYTRMLRREFDNCAQKYGFRAMQLGDWKFGKMRPVNHPVLRLAEAAEFFSQDEFVLNRTLQCRTERDVRELFCIEAPEYWRTHYLPGVESDERPKRIGRDKANIIGINLVAVLQYAYGCYMGKEELRGNALELLESLEPERNHFMKRWEALGFAPANAFESQALLQLTKNFCILKRCDRCPVGHCIRCAVEKKEKVNSKPKNDRK